MPSHRAEVWGILTVFLFINEYYRYLLLTNESNIIYRGENLEVVAKLRNIQSNPHYYDEYIYTTDHDTVQILKYYISQ